MSEKSESAIALFLDDRFSCAQSVLAVFCEDYGLDKVTALKVASGLGGGVRCGELCGAVSGAAQVIGLKYGQFVAGDLETKNICYEKTREFALKFKEIHGSMVCRELLDGNDIHFMWTSTDEKVKKMGLDFHVEVCAKLVESAVKILEELGY